MRYPSLLALLLLAACGAEGDHTIDRVFDPCSPLTLDAADASEAERTSLADAIAMWNERAGSRLTTEAVAGVPVLPVRFESAAGTFFGLYDDERAIVYVNRGIAGAHERAVTVAHELGHAFGLAHLEAEVRASVMNVNNLTVEPNDGDVADLAELWGYCD